MWRRAYNTVLESVMYLIDNYGQALVMGLKFGLASLFGVVLVLIGGFVSVSGMLAGREDMVGQDKMMLLMKGTESIFMKVIGGADVSIDPSIVSVVLLISVLAILAMVILIWISSVFLVAFTRNIVLNEQLDRKLISNLKKPLVIDVTKILLTFSAINIVAYLSVLMGAARTMVSGPDDWAMVVLPMLALLPFTIYFGVRVQLAIVSLVSERSAGIWEAIAATKGQFLGVFLAMVILFVLQFLVNLVTSLIGVGVALVDPGILLMVYNLLISVLILPFTMFINTVIFAKYFKLVVEE